MDIIDFYTFGRLSINDGWQPLALRSLNKLYCVYGGSAYFGDRRLEPGHLYLFSDCARTKWRIGENFDHLYFDFFINPPFNFSGVIDIGLSDKPALAAVCDAASAVFTGYDRSEVIDAARTLLGTLLLLCDKIAPLRATGDERVDAAIEYICGNIDRNIRVGELAALTHLEKCYFIKLFRRGTGKTPYRYACDQRLNRSFAMLERGTAVSEAALMSGYQSDAAFSGAFRKRFGVSPGTVRSGAYQKGSAPALKAKIKT